MLSENLRLLRTDRGMSQAALAKACGFRQEYLSALERGLRPSRPQHVPKLARALNVRTDQLTGPLLINLVEVGT